ncbi:hypothetical protein NEIELOOT_01288 [Neisseria elongata subsp. glycolytica ATCC 29315]|uniref:Uncharacterized protein n=1 Tax=Neisseria elongata subsp. glycolytica ATCC 29315 TaxID=546263 RepID=D4DQF2_NEIEG|nr:hypothetical protein NEIELOOT_01288 [Neisseria elongata subsp. glycolytica ATCC 29315]
MAAISDLLLHNRPSENGFQTASSYALSVFVHFGKHRLQHRFDIRFFPFGIHIRRQQDIPRLKQARLPVMLHETHAA